jgi:hypothetical protein
VPDQNARREFGGRVVATLRLNPDPSHETKARRVGHPENQMRASTWFGRVDHPPAVRFVNELVS